GTMNNYTQKNTNLDRSHIDIPTVTGNINSRQIGGIVMKFFKKTLFNIGVSMLTLGQLIAGGAGTSGGPTLTEPFGARPASLGEAFTAVTNDISAFGYNPASLKGLES